MTLPFTLIGVPIDSAGSAGGTELAPAALRSLGLGEAIAGSDRGDLDVCLSTAEVCQIGPSAAGQQAASALSDPPGAMWVHLDLDIVDPDLFFANDAPVPGGLDWSQLTELLGPLCSSSALAGFSLGCYNPEKDRGADNGRHIVEMFRKVLTS